MSSWAELATRTIEEKLRNAAKSVPGVLDARNPAYRLPGINDRVFTAVELQFLASGIRFRFKVTGAAGEASPELVRKVGDAIEPLKGNYEDYLVKSSTFLTVTLMSPAMMTLFCPSSISPDGCKMSVFL